MSSIKYMSASERAGQPDRRREPSPSSTSCCCFGLRRACHAHLCICYSCRRSLGVSRVGIFARNPDWTWRRPNRAPTTWPVRREAGLRRIAESLPPQGGAGRARRRQLPQIPQPVQEPLKSRCRGVSAGALPLSSRERLARAPTRCSLGYLFPGVKLWLLNGNDVGVWMRIKPIPAASWHALQDAVSAAKPRSEAAPSFAFMAS